jgi:hypothetical protein
MTARWRGLSRARNETQSIQLASPAKRRRVECSGTLPATAKEAIADAAVTQEHEEVTQVA